MAKQCDDRYDIVAHYGGDIDVSLKYTCNFPYSSYLTSSLLLICFFDTIFGKELDDVKSALYLHCCVFHVGLGFRNIVVTQ